MIVRVWCRVLQVSVRFLDANPGRGRSGSARRAFSTHDLWPSTPIRSPPDHSDYTLAAAERSDPTLAKQRRESWVQGCGRSRIAHSYEIGSTRTSNAIPPSEDSQVSFNGFI